MNPKFAIIDLPGVPPARLSSLIEPGTDSPDKEGEIRIVLRRAQALDMTSMTEQELADLENTEIKQVEMTEARLNALTEVKTP